MASKARSIANFKIFSNNIANGAISFNNIGNIFTSNIIEFGSTDLGNIYFSNTRARNAFIAGSNITIDYNTGTITAAGGGNAVDLSTYTGNITAGNIIITGKYYGDGSSLTGITASVSGLSTSNVAEGSNLYFTNSRAALAAIPATTQLVLTTPVFNYNLDQYSGDNPTIYVTAGETISFELNQSASHPFAIRVSNGGSNYDTGLTHVDDDGTVSTGSGAQGKYSGKLFWKVPFDLSGNTYVYQCTVHSSMVGNIVIQSPVSTGILTGLTTSTIAEGSNLYYTNARVISNVSLMSINVLADVDTTGLQNDYYLKWNGSQWVPSSVSAVADTSNLSLISNFANTANIANIVLSLNNFTTSNLAEGGNLYYTNARVFSNVIALLPRYTGDITANTITVVGRFVGDGSGLTNLSTPAPTSNLAALPSYNGNALIANLVVTGNTNTNTLIVSNFITGINTTSNVTIFTAGNVVIDTGPFETRFLNDGNVVFPSNVIATRFIGDGSLLTGITTSGSAANLSSLATYNGNALIANLVVTGNATIGNLSVGGSSRLSVTNDNNTTIRSGLYTYTFGDTGLAIFPNLILSGGALLSTVLNSTNTVISTGDFNFTFGSDGTFYAPNVRANLFGDGSGLTGIVTSTTLTTYNGNILAANLTANTIFADRIFASNIIDGAGSTVITLTGETNTIIQHGAFTSSFTNQGNVFMPNVIANKFFGDGSGITNINAAAALGSLGVYNGNALIANLVVSGNATVGNLSVGNATIGNLFIGATRLSITNDNNTTIRAGIYNYTFGDTGLAIFPNLLLSGGALLSASMSTSNTIINTGDLNFTFGTDGTFYAPNVRANLFGDGTNLTGVLTTQTLRTYNGNILVANLTANTIFADFIYASNIIDGLGSTVITLTADTNTTIRHGIFESRFTNQGNVFMPNVIANKFFGDGSGLTGITSAATLQGMSSYNGNALISNLVVTGNATVSNIVVSGNATVGNLFIGSTRILSTGGSNTTIRAGIYTYTFSDVGDLILPANIVTTTSNTSFNAKISATNSTNTTISSGAFADVNYVFADDGIAYLPNARITGNLITSNIIISLGSSLRAINNSNVRITAGNFTYTFSDSGLLSLPGNISIPSGGSLSSTTDSNTIITAGNFDFNFDNTGEFGSANIFARSGIFVGSDTNTNAYITNSSKGASTTTLYIGNQSITTSSDVRLKDNIANTSLQAINIVNNLRVVDFTWNDPTDLAFNNKNARGKWTGLIAQETINHLPFVVNAVRDSDTLDPIPDSKDDKGKNLYWGIEYDKIVPVLIKAVQEQQTLIEELKSRIQTLEQINN